MENFHTVFSHPFVGPWFGIGQTLGLEDRKSSFYGRVVGVSKGGNFHRCDVKWTAQYGCRWLLMFHRGYIKTTLKDNVPICIGENMHDSHY